MNWENFSVVIPIIVLIVTLLFNMRKEKRDRDYEHRPIASFHSLNDLRTEKVIGNHLMLNEEVSDLYHSNSGHYFKINNVCKSPMLNVSVIVKYKDSFPKQHYQILIIEENQSFIVPVSKLNSKDTSKWENELDEIKITYRSLSGQKYTVKYSHDGKLTVQAHRHIIFYETIISSEGNKKTKFEKY